METQDRSITNKSQDSIYNKTNGYWKCSNCGYIRDIEEEVYCWECGIGEMVFHEILKSCCECDGDYTLRENNWCLDCEKTNGGLSCQD